MTFLITLNILLFLLIVSMLTLVVSSDSAVSEKRFGVNYDPLHDMEGYQSKGIIAVLRDDMHQIAQRFSAVRTFQAIFDGVEVGPYIADAGLKASIGIRTEVDDHFLWRQINAAIDAAHDPRRYVSMITVGNENLYTGTSASKLIWIIRHIKQNVPDDVQVMTVQRPNEYLELHGPIPHLKELVQVSGVIGLNVYPFFSKMPSNMGTMEMLKIQWNQVQGRFPHVKIVLTETGWPDVGGRNFADNVADHHQAVAHYRAFRQHFFAPDFPGAHLDPDEVYYFQFFNQPYKGGQFEPHFGLTSHVGTPKFKIYR